MNSIREKWFVGWFVSSIWCLGVAIAIIVSILG